MYCLVLQLIKLLGIELFIIINIAVFALLMIILVSKGNIEELDTHLQYLTKDQKTLQIGILCANIFISTIEKSLSKVDLNNRLLLGLTVITCLALLAQFVISKGKNLNKTVQAKKEKRVLFKDIGGLSEAKEEMKELLAFLHNPDRFSALGASCSKGIIMTGSPGVGKTMLAKALANEAGLNFFYRSGTEFVTPYIGLGSIKIREFFAQAKKEAPSIVFIDEIESIARRRGVGNIAGYEMDNMVNTLLTELDGFTERGQVIVIAATNDYDSIDPAVLRPGRFDTKIFISLPTKSDRLEIVRALSNKYNLSPQCNLDNVASMTIGCSGADLDCIFNRAAIIAGRLDASCITNEHLLEAFYDIVTGGTVQKNKNITKDSFTRTAYHETGHVLVALLLDSDRPLAATILPRGKSLGSTIFAPNEDEIDIYTFTRKQAFNKLQVALGGFAAEEIIYGIDNVSSGASNDHVYATNLASAMVKKFGWSDVLGHVSVNDDTPFIYSEKQKEKVDSAISEILNSSYDATKKILTSNIHYVEMLKNALLQKETMKIEEIEELLKIKHTQIKPIQ